MEQSEEEKLQAVFDSYCKTVIRNAGRNIHKRYKRQIKNEIMMDFSSGGFLDEATQSQEFPSERLFVTYKAQSYPMKSLKLYELLMQLPPKQLEVIILKYWCKHTDQQAADLIGVTARTVRNRRTLAQKKIRTRWKGE